MEYNLYLNNNEDLAELSELFPSYPFGMAQAVLEGDRKSPSLIRFYPTGRVGESPILYKRYNGNWTLLKVVYAQAGERLCIRTHTGSIDVSVATQEKNGKLETILTLSSDSCVVSAEGGEVQIKL